MWRLEQASQGVSLVREQLGTTPLTIYRPQVTDPAPAVVVAHGFAGSQQLMQPFALTLARNGYLVITFDFPGHAGNSEPLPGGLDQYETLNRRLVDTLSEVVAHARQYPGADGRVATLGHSMAADVVVRQALIDPDLVASVAVSLFVPEDVSTSVPDRPRNLLIINGALEPAAMHEQGLSIVSASLSGAEPGGAEAGVTYGRFEAGSARRLALSPGAEHIGVLYNGDSLREALEWLDTAFEHRGSGFLDRRGGALGWLLLGLIGLAWPLAQALPRREALAAPRQPGGRRWWAVALGPAVLTPLILWPLPSAFLPILLGDYLALHFGLYGLLTLVGLRFVLGPEPGSQSLFPTTRSGLLRVAASVVAVAGFSVFLLGAALDRYLIDVTPGPWRLPLIVAMAVGTVPWFLADEWLTRRKARPPGAYAWTKALFLVSLSLAVALNIAKLFFLVIIVPVILLLFVVYGLFSAWVHKRSGEPVVAALAHGWVFAWLIAATFPVVGG